MSLSFWLRDYLYKPLGGRRHGPWHTARNLMITMLLGGIWHGAAWKFLAWGGLHGGGLVLERWLDPWRGAWARTTAGRAVAILVVFHLVCLGWILFRAEDWEAVTIYLGALVQPRDLPVQASAFAVGLIVLGLALHAGPRDLPARIAHWFGAWPDWACSAAAGASLVAIDALGPDGVAPFIYFQF